MKTIVPTKMVFALGSIAALALVLLAGCVVEPNGRVRAGVVVSTPGVTVESDVVPDDYVWDGYEYVGVVGDQYYYLGSGNVWLVCDPVRIRRFHAWVGVHPDWHAHAVRNDRFRNDSHGHYHARRDEH